MAFTEGLPPVVSNFLPRKGTETSPEAAPAITINVSNFLPRKGTETVRQEY